MKKYNLLFIEENPMDIKLFKDSIYPIADEWIMTIALDGDMAFKKLEDMRTEGYRPDLIVTSLNLPRMNGKEILKKIKADIHWKDIPVIVFSTSSYQPDIDEVLQYDALKYIVKPFDIKDYRMAVEDIFVSWACDLCEKSAA